jgi:hypothetical protein
LTVVEKDVNSLKTAVDDLKNDVNDLQVRVSVLSEDVNIIKSDVSSLRLNFVDGFICLFLLISLGFANNSVSSQNMERRMEATRLEDIKRMEATRLEDIKRMEAIRLEDIKRTENNRGIDRWLMFAIALLPLVGPIASKTLKL